jgi:hypothetical protein
MGLSLADWILFISAIVLFCAVDLKLMEKNYDEE